MTANGIAQIVFYLVVLTALTPPLGAYIARVYEGRRIPGLSRVLGPVERGHLPAPAHRHREASRAGRPTPARCWPSASRASRCCTPILRLQGHLPLNPADLPGMSWYVAFNTAASFVTNTNWQFYGGESTLSYLSQMFGLTVQNFVSAAVGMAVLAAVIRGLRPPRPRRARQLLGRPGADHALHPAAAGDRDGPGDRAPRASSRPSTTRSPTRPSRRAPSAPPTRRGQPVTQTITARARRVADRHQAARHQRRRLLQRQLGRPLREPDAAHQLPRDAGDPADPGGADLHLRDHGRLARAGLGALRDDDGRAGRRDRRPPLPFEQRGGEVLQQTGVELTARRTPPAAT